MKTTLAIFSFIATIAFTSMAMATIWSVSGNNLPFYFSTNGSTYSTALDLSKPGYVIDNAELVLTFTGFGTVTNIASIDSSSHGVTVLNLLAYDVTKLLNNGILNLGVSGKSSFNFFGDSMNLSSVCLTAVGEQGHVPSSVPEPGTIMLLGAGLLAVTIYKRRHSK